MHLRKSQDGGDVCDDGNSDESEDEGEDKGSEGDSGDVSGGEDCDDEYLSDDGDSGEHVSGGEDDGDGSDSGEEEASSRKSDVDEQELDGNGSLDRLEGTNDERRGRVDVEESGKLTSKSGDINSNDGSDNDDDAADDDDFDGDDDDDDDDSGRDADSGDDLEHFREHDDKQMPSNSTNDSKGKKTPRKDRKQPISKDLAKVSKEPTFYYNVLVGSYNCPCKLLVCLSYTYVYKEHGPCMYMYLCTMCVLCLYYVVRMLCGQIRVQCANICATVIAHLLLLLKFVN